MKIWTHLYSLQPGADTTRAARSVRHGALLKVKFDDEAIGYADLHTWPEFGQAALREQLATLTHSHPAPQARIALRHARTDAAARRAGLSLFDGLTAVSSHALFTDWTAAPREVFAQCASEGFTAVKLKIGHHPEQEAARLDDIGDLPLRWRLDANASFKNSGALNSRFLAKLSPEVRANIEFLEDPFPYAPSAWTTFTSKEKLPLALDWEVPSSPPRWPGAQILVIKPAAQDAFPLALAAAHAGMEIVVTHCMDHPLGQAVALWTAMRLRQRHGDLVRDGGLIGSGLYQTDDFSASWPSNGPVLPPPAGTGFGFDQQLAGISWQPLAS